MIALSITISCKISQTRNIMASLNVKLTGDLELKKLAARAHRELGGRKVTTGIGIKVLSWVNQNFRAGGLDSAWKQLRPNTLAGRRGGSGQPLRDTGRLAQSYNYNAGSTSVDIGTPSKIAPFHEEGTQPYKIRPKSIGGKLRFMTVGGFAFASVVNHPGLPRRRMLPTEQTAAKLSISILEAAVEKVNG